MDVFATEEYQYRFGGIARLYGKKALELFSKTPVMVIGLGGVGSWTAECLVRSGFANVCLVDFDDICVSNTNRQLHTLKSTIGHFKGDVLKSRFLEISPQANIVYLDRRLDELSIDEILSNRPSFVVDAIDDANLKALLISKTHQLGIDVVVSGASGGRRDPTKILAKDLTQTIEDPLLSRVRKLLRQKYGFPRGQKKFQVPAVFSTEKAFYPMADGCVSQEEASDMKGPMDCATGFGAVTHLTGSMGFMLAGQLMDQLIKKAEL